MQLIFTCLRIKNPFVFNKLQFFWLKKKSDIQFMKNYIRLILFLGSLFFTAIISFNVIVKQSSSLYLYDSISEIPSKETALVLGSNKFGKFGGINPYYKYRINAAFELFSQKKVEKIIVSGDNHSQGYDETSAMAQSLVDLGVPDSCIIRDYAGFRTLDSVVRAKKVFNCSELIIVSQKFHNERAVFAARFFGIDALGYNAKDVRSKNNYTHFREIGAKFLMVLDLYCLNTQPRFL